ncbi:MurR/RpiR family transcriptional regulator [uncultured Thomasclavelia sp.]|uniref:MurR/RpiR family transcriptional regulator n=1 Tax=uncultured Thomasclavelia sp. TaxID=3025759 RepID=UPI0025EF8D25|nr:MurR/RpiR family transcriptional regulator [uncultured Thomasclavelia sp.]
MNILLSRILTYLNGAFVYDDYYRFCKFVVYNYLGFEDLSLKEVVEKSGVPEDKIITFCQLLGYDGFETFQNELLRTHMVRLDQIRARMLGVNSDQLINDMEKSCSNEEMKEYISTICEAIFKAKRVVIFGAMYPLSIAVELQTDLITFGKPVIQYQSFDKDIVLDENDVTIFITATGRSMNTFVEIKKELGVALTTSILITQNRTYELDEYKISDYVLRVPGKFDGINFNYQIMTICDLLRVHYYTQYYL